MGVGTHMAVAAAQMGGYDFKTASASATGQGVGATIASSAAGGQHHAALGLGSNGEYSPALAHLSSFQHVLSQVSPPASNGIGVAAAAALGTGCGGSVSCAGALAGHTGYMPYPFMTAAGMGMGLDRAVGLNASPASASAVAASAVGSLFGRYATDPLSAAATMAMYDVKHYGSLQHIQHMLQAQQQQAAQAQQPMPPNLSTPTQYTNNNETTLVHCHTKADSTASASSASYGSHVAPSSSPTSSLEHSDAMKVCPPRHRYRYRFAFVHRRTLRY